MRFNGTNEIKQFNLVYKLGMVMNNHEQEIPFLLIWNGIIDSRLPFIIGNQWYFQKHYCSHSISFPSVPSHSFSLEQQSCSNLLHSILLLIQLPTNIGLG
jgi:hypothetical protein